jgi:hypothetical protein
LLLFELRDARNGKFYLNLRVRFPGKNISTPQCQLAISGVNSEKYLRIVIPVLSGSPTPCLAWVARVSELINSSEIIYGRVIAACEKSVSTADDGENKSREFGGLSERSST